jgi:dCTP diphosphatase
LGVAALMQRLLHANAQRGLRKRSAAQRRLDWSGRDHWVVGWDDAPVDRPNKQFLNPESPMTQWRVALAPPAALRHGRAMMHDATTTVAALRERVMDFAREREWEQFHSPKNLSMALAAEAGELMEHFLWTDSAASHAVARDPAKREKIADEIADVVIYALEFANISGLDLATAIEAKLAKNAAKYPVEKARGNAKKYTDL